MYKGRGIPIKHNGDYQQLIKRLEQEADTHPQRYASKVRWLTLLGYGYIWFILLIGLAFIGGLLTWIYTPHSGSLLAIKLLIVAAVLIFIIGKALWFKLEEPEGFEIKQKQAPELFAKLELIRKQVGAPVMHKVIVNEEFNAAIVQLPRFGFFGFHRNYLILGYPLMRMLSLTEFESVIAHEMGHLSGRHGKLGSFVYRTRKTWGRLLEAMEQEKRTWATFIFERFFKRYTPYFLAYTFVLSRQQEYEADAYSARMVGSEEAASSLLAVEVKACALDEYFWAGLMKENEKSVITPRDVFTRMKKFAGEELPTDFVREAANKAFMKETDILDTHPCLRDRVKQLIGKETVDFVQKEPMASLFGPSEEALLSAMNEVWYEMYKESWVKRYHELNEAKERLSVLNSKPVEQLNEEETVEFAVLLDRMESPERVLQILEPLLARFPDHALIHFLIGKNKLQIQDESGIAFLQRSMELDKNAIFSASEWIIDFLLEQGREKEAEPFLSVYLEQGAYLEKVDEERSEITTSDLFLPHDLTPDDLADLNRQFAAYPEIREVYLVQKQLELEQDQPLYVFGISFSRPWNTLNEAKFDAEFIDRIGKELVFGEEAYLVPLILDNFWFKKKCKQIPDSLIYKNR